MVDRIHKIGGGGGRIPDTEGAVSQSRPEAIPGLRDAEPELVMFEEVAGMSPAEREQTAALIKRICKGCIVASSTTWNLFHRRQSGTSENPPKAACPECKPKPQTRKSMKSISDTELMGQTTNELKETRIAFLLVGRVTRARRYCRGKSGAYGVIAPDLNPSLFIASIRGSTLTTNYARSSKSGVEHGQSRVISDPSFKLGGEEILAIMGSQRQEPSKSIIGNPPVQVRLDQTREKEIVSRRTNACVAEFRAVGG